LAAPLLIDPTQEDPWRRLFLDTDTGMVAPRFTQDGSEDPKAQATLQVLGTLLDEAVSEGRLSTIRRIRRTAEACLHTTGNDSHLVSDLIHEVRDDTFGVAAWFLRWEGANEQPFSSLRVQCKSLWRRLVALQSALEYGG
jgi:hypothetical protein